MEVIDHPWFQRLRRIKQLGLTEMVYPGALHTRFAHALGAMHLMNTAMGSLAERGTEITAQECEAAMLAILLHDVGHGPFSHALEKSILSNVSHEQVSEFILGRMVEQLGGSLQAAVPIFNGTYHRPFFNHLVASQLDCDRLDYLKRDCFFTGVLEGAIGATRLLKMLATKEDHLAVEYKGIYSVENFLNSRRVMYWQVYLHKTTVCAEEILIRLIKRARQLIAAGAHVPAPDYLLRFFRKEITITHFHQQPDVAECFMQLDDSDIWNCIKQWRHHPDKVLGRLALALYSRRLFQVKLLPHPPSPEWQQMARQILKEKLALGDEEVDFFLIQGKVENAAYMADAPPIMMLHRDGRLQDITQASDLPHIQAMARTVTKYYVCYPKEVTLPPMP